LEWAHRDAEWAHRYAEWAHRYAEWAHRYAPLPDWISSFARFPALITGVAP